MGETAAVEKRSHEARPLGRAASNALARINDGNKADIRDAAAGIESLMRGDTRQAYAALHQIMARNIELREAGVFVRAAMYAEADEALMTLSQQEREWADHLKAMRGGDAAQRRE